MNTETQTKDLFPAEIIVSKDAIKVSTLLGSCVSVCLWDPINGYGGINHFMLPYWNGKGLASPKYGNIAMETLLQKMINLGSKKSNIQAKIFGGGQVLQMLNNHFDIGPRNIQYARSFLSSEGIRIVSSSVGGTEGRKIIFDTLSGMVLMRFIKRSTITN